MQKAVRFLFALALVLAGCAGADQAPTFQPADSAASEQSALGAAPRVIVTGKTGASMEDLHARVSRAGGAVEHNLEIINGVIATLPDKAAAKRLSEESGILRVEDDAVAHASGKPGSSPPPPQAVPWGVTAVGAPMAAYTGNGVDVAVIDTGIDSAHTDLAVVGGYNFTSVKSGAWKDDNGHGTHVAGTIAARNNAYGVIGVAPQARLYALKVLGRNGSGRYSDIIAAINWSVLNGMDVINMSLGGPSDVQALHDACDAAAAAGVLVFAAAGNEGDGNAATNDVGYPAGYASTIAVAAVDSAMTVAYFSSDGPAVDVAAPGVNITSTILGGGYQGGWNGTSMAAPHAAGVGALLKQAYPALSGACLRSHLESSATDLGDPGADVFYGHGFVSAPAAIASAAAGCP